MSTRTRLIFGAICAVYICVRLWRLTDSCLWFDELFSVHAAEHDWGALFSFVAKDLIHPPLFYVLLKLWLALGGDSLFWLRLLPVLFSILAIFPFVRLCRELKLDTGVLLLSLGLLAINGALIKYTQTVRMYSMLMFFALVSMWLFARYFNRGKSFIPLVITNILLVYTHYFGWLVVAAEIAAILSFQRIKWRQAIVMFVAVTAAFVPWFIAVWQAASSGSDVAQNIGWQARPGLRELLTFTTDLVEPFYYQSSSADAASIYFVSTPMLLLFSTAIGLFVMEWKRDERNRTIYFLLLFVALPILIAFLISWLLPHSVWGTRHLIIVVPPAMILVAIAILGSAVRAFRIIAVSLVVVLAAIGFATEVRREMPRYVWCAWDDVAADIRAKDPSAKVYAFENLVAYHLWFALRDSARNRVGLAKGVDVPNDDAAYFLPRGFDQVEVEPVEEITDEKFWVAFRAAEPEVEQLILRTFETRSYRVCRTEKSTLGSVKIHWVEISRVVGCG